MKMNRKFQNIRENFVDLVNNIEPDILINFLLSEKSQKCIRRQDVKHIQVEKDYKHKNRLLLFLILKKNDNVYDNFVKGLELFGLKHLLVSPPQSHATVFKKYRDETEILSLSSLSLNDTIETTTTTDYALTKSARKALVVKVKLAETFKATDCDNVYNTTSSKRGQVLIINNKFFDPYHRDRKGSEFDLICLEQLFKQMFMNVKIYEDLNKKEMEDVIIQFAKFDDDKISDICVVVIMSHGEERNKELVVLDKQNDGLKTSWIEEQFNNINCPLFSGKPKVFLYQFCRGPQLDYATTKVRDQENKGNEVTPIDTIIAQNQNNIETDSGNMVTIQRRLEDMLVGYATQKGHMAHRDPNLGSWYIQLISEVFMERAHDTHILDMLNEVDRRLKVYTCPDFSMQTSSYTSNGFNKNLYFNPGIYLDNSGNVQKFS